MVHNDGQGIKKEKLKGSIHACKISLGTCISFSERMFLEGTFIVVLIRITFKSKGNH